MEIKTKKSIIEYCENCKKDTENINHLNLGIASVECAECGYIKRLKGL